MQMPKGCTSTVAGVRDGNTQVDEPAGVQGASSRQAFITQIVCVAVSSAKTQRLDAGQLGSQTAGGVQVKTMSTPSALGWARHLAPAVQEPMVVGSQRVRQEVPPS
jgi:hypothetical protein